MVIMPTGGGKSLCFQVPALLLPGVTLVVSPLIALMKDQVDALRSRGIAATFINSSIDKREKEDRYERLKRGEYKLVYVTPERFQKHEFLESLKSVRISLFAVDEAHCISEWGSDFRPEYSRLGEIVDSLGNPPVMALTATATPRTREDILKILKIENAFQWVGSIERPNLWLGSQSVYGLDEKVRNLVGLRHLYPGPAILYSSLISTLQKVSSELSRLGLKHFVYHGDLRPQDRKKSQEQFLKSNDGLMLATPAFGLGVDKADIRWIAHAEIPRNLESYYQEVGRAGRDGVASRAYLMFDEDDVSIQMEFLKWSNPEPDFIISLFRVIEKNESRVAAEGADFLRAQMNFYNKRDYRVETALNLLERWEHIEWGESIGGGRRALRLISEPTGDFVNRDLFQRRLRGQNQKLLEMVQYAQSTSCRKVILSKYFGEVSKLSEPCGQCDVCEA